MEKVASFFTGLYVWIINIFFGAILLDIIYSGLIASRNIEAAEIFEEVSDFLLIVGAVVIIAAVVSIVLSWKSKIARYLFIASFLIIIFEFLGPVFFSKFVQEFAGGQWIRLAISGISSILASTGLHYFYKHWKAESNI
jgi:hypothetical protein